MFLYPFKDTKTLVLKRIGLIKILLDEPKCLIRHNVERFIISECCMFTKTNGSICAKMKQKIGT